MKKVDRSYPLAIVISLNLPYGRGRKGFDALG